MRETIWPDGHFSAKPMWDVLTGEDPALRIMEACSLGDTETLQSLLLLPQWCKTMLDKQNCIRVEARPKQKESDLREVYIGELLNITRAMHKAVFSGHTAIVSTLLNFVVQQDIELWKVITPRALYIIIDKGHTAILKALASVDPEIVHFCLGLGDLLLDVAVQARQVEIVALLFQLGASLVHPVPQFRSERVRGYPSTLLCQATRLSGARLTQILLEHGAPIAYSGALHGAAECGALDSMRLLIQHGANVNEQLLESDMPPYWSSRIAWTPMHCAAFEGQVDAMKLLESNGARSDYKDKKGRTPLQILEEGKLADGK